MELIKAFSNSSGICIRTNETTYSNTILSHGTVIAPWLGRPNSSSDILNSSMKTFLLRYSKGTMNLFSTVVYTTKWPLSATNTFGLSPLLGYLILLRLAAALLCHFLAISMIETLES
ncbi:hypothetical protein ACOSQ3_005980 [Xanthoceras sorbifolium]